MDKFVREKPPEVLVVACGALFSDGICALIHNSGSCVVAGSAGISGDAIDKTRELKPDVLLIDTAMSVPDIERLIRVVRHENDKARILLFGTDDNEEPIIRGLIAGARGYISNAESGPALVAAVLEVYHGESFISPSVTKLLVAEYCKTRTVIDHDPYFQLSAREKEILRLIADGYTSRVIAEKLNISAKTVMGCRAKLMKKLGIHSATQLVKYAIRKNLVELDTS